MAPRPAGSGGGGSGGVGSGQRGASGLPMVVGGMQLKFKVIQRVVGPPSKGAPLTLKGSASQRSWWASQYFGSCDQACSTRQPPQPTLLREPQLCGAQGATLLTKARCMADDHGATVSAGLQALGWAPCYARLAGWTHMASAGLVVCAFRTSDRTCASQRPASPLRHRLARSQLSGRRRVAYRRS